MSWGARALYVGPGFGLSPHRNAVAVLAMDLDGEDDLIVLLAGLPRSSEGRRSASPSLSTALRFQNLPSDRRIVSAVDVLLRAPGLEADTATLAARAFLDRVTLLERVVDDYELVSRQTSRFGRLTKTPKVRVTLRVMPEPRAASPGQNGWPPHEPADSEISLCNHATTLAQTGWSWRCARRDWSG